MVFVQSIWICNQFQKNKKSYLVVYSSSNYWKNKIENHRIERPRISPNIYRKNLTKHFHPFILQVLFISYQLVLLYGTSYSWYSWLSSFKGWMPEIRPKAFWGVVFARGKFKFKLFLNVLWYEPETLCLFLTFTGDYFGGKKNSKKY